MVHPSGRPAPRTRFVGRRAFLAGLLKLAARERLVTVVGVGGAGKTRSVLALLDDAGPGFGESIWVELAPVSDPGLVPSALCAALGLRPGPGVDPLDAASRRLETVSGTLVLDNCEHLLDAAARLAHELLLRCPDLRIVATSREPLEIDGEVVHPLPPLSVPQESVGDPSAALACESVRLFLDRVARVRPDFELTADTVRPVTDICRRLDGIPLALELAAARTRGLGVQAIAERLDAVLPLLSGKDRTAPARHRTMTAAIEWSHSLLDPDERAIFRRLGAFGGGGDLAACEAVCSSEGLPAPRIPEVLTRLVDRSLVTVDDRGPAFRYRLLEPIAQFARMRLDESGEGNAVGERHTRWYLALAERLGPELRGGGRETALGPLEIELDNLRRVWDRAVSNEDHDVLGRLAFHHFWLWNFTGLFSEGRRRVDGALEATAGDGTDSAPLLWAGGTLAWITGDLEHARDRLERAVAMTAPAVDPHLPGMCLRELAGATLSEGRPEEADRLYRQALERLPPATAPWDRALALVSAGFVRSALGDEAGAESVGDEGRALFARTGDPWGLALAEHMLGVGAGQRGDAEQALAHGEVALGLQRSYGDLWNVAQVLLLVAEAELHLGRVDEAGRHVREAIVSSEAMGDLITLAFGAELLARVEARTGNAERALQLAGAAARCRDRAGGARYPYALDREDPDAWLQATRASVGPSDAGTAWASGIATGPEGIVGLARRGDEDRERSAYGPVGRGDPTLRIRALGPPEVRRGPRRLGPEDWGYALPRELLFNLLVKGPRTKEQIGLDFWPEADADQLRGRFRTALYQVRQALGGKDWVVYRAGRYAFRSDGDHWFDVTAFEEAVAAGRARVQTNPDEATADLEAAVGLYRGDFLDGEAPGAWAEPVRRRLRSDFLKTLSELGRIRRTQGALDRAEALFRRACQVDSLGEAHHLELGKILAERGARAEALDLLAAYGHRLDEELGASPGPAVTEFVETLRRP